MTGLLAALLLVAQQAGPPTLGVTVDRDQVVVGEELTVTLRAVSRSQSPLQIRLPDGALEGFGIVSRTERTEVAFGGGTARVTVLELRLRALRAGDFDLGPFEARQDDHLIQAGTVAVEVADGGGAASLRLNPRVARLLERAGAPARAGEVGLTLMLSADTVTVGEQVDVITAAWFPRDLRLQLRRPPTLTPPGVDGMWSYPQPAPVGIAASRRVDGTWYDLFVTHQIVFPLTEGVARVGPASLAYSVPLALQFFSQEERYSITSDTARVRVRALPPGRPLGFTGVVARDLTIRATVSPAAVTAGQPLALELILTGEGNLALWPEPTVAWPATVRAYAEQVAERPVVTAGRVGGTKRFRFTVVPDSAGTVRIPSVSYPYYDYGSRSYRIARTDPLLIPVAPTEAPAARELALALMPPGGPPPAVVAADLVRSLPGLAVLALPPLAWALLALVRRRRPRVHVPRRSRSLAAVEQELDRLARALAPEAEGRDEGALLVGLRSTGLEPALAERIVGLRARVREARYAEQRATGRPPQALAKEWDAIRRTLALRRVRGRRHWDAALALLLLLCPAVSAGQAADESAGERLYAAGAFDAAATAFAVWIEAEPWSAAHRHNFGAAAYRVRHDGLAAAAWHSALRRDPRNATLRSELRLVRPPTGESGLLWTPPVTPDELLAIGALVWLVGWGGVLLARRRRTWVVVAGIGLLVGLGGVALAAHYRRPVGIAAREAPLRLSPHGRADVLATLPPGGAARVRREVPGWALVRDDAGRQGWVERDALIPVEGFLPGLAERAR